MVPKPGSTYAAAIGFVLLWNSGFIGAEFGLPYSGPFTLMFWRYLSLAALLTSLKLLWRRPILARSKMAGVAPTAIIGILSHGVWLGCVLLSLNRGVDAGIVALVVALQPLTTGAFAELVTGERTSLRQWFGLVLGFAGVAIAVVFRIEQPGPASVFAYLLPFGSVVAITVASLVQRSRVLSGHAVKMSLYDQLLVQAAATALFVTVPAIAMENLATEWTPVYLSTMVWLIVSVSFGAYLLMWTLLARTDATRVASLFYFGPPVTMVMAWIAFGDKPIATDVIGLVVIATAVLIVTHRH